MYTSTSAVTNKDIQVKTIRTDANPHNQNRVRKAWVLHCDETSAKQLQSLPQEVKFMLYSVIDEEVNDKWLELMREHKEQSIKQGAKFVLDKVGGERLEDDYCIDTDDLLVRAGELIGGWIPGYIATLPKSIQKQMIAIEV